MPRSLKVTDQNEYLDLKGVPCPHNTGKIFLRLEGMEQGSVLEVVIDDGEPHRKVPAAIREEGYEILTEVRQNDQWRLHIRKV